MKKCKHCGAQNEDDNLFCTECGNELPKGMVCPNCGTFLDVGDTFCSNCGKKIEEQVVPDDSLSLRRKCPYCGAVLDEDDVFCSSCGKKVEEHKSNTQETHQRKYINCGRLLEEDDVNCPNYGDKNDLEPPLPGSDNNDISDDKTDIKNTQDNSTPIPVDYENNSLSDNINKEGGEGDDNIIAEKAKTLNLRKLFAVVAGVILLAAISCGCWYGFNTLFGNQQAANKDFDNHGVVEKKGNNTFNVDNEEVLQGGKVFLENFYKGLDNCSEDGLLAYVKKNVTQRAFAYLKDEFPYEDGCDECYATWMFTFEAGCDCDKLLNRIIEQESDNTFLVTNTWGYEGLEQDSSYITDYKVRLGIVKEEDSYKINTIENVNEKEREELYTEINQYSRYVGQWILRKTTDEGRKMHIEITLKENKSGDMVVFNDRGNVADVIAYEEYPQCILEDNVIYMTKNGVITKGSPKLRVSSDGLYSYDGIKYTRKSEKKPR